jgi:hypothetical protein
MLGRDCWFCDHGGDLVFDCEFDTAVHVECIRKALEEDPENPEAQIMSYLLTERTISFAGDSDES